MIAGIAIAVLGLIPGIACAVGAVRSLSSAVSMTTTGRVYTGAFTQQLHLGATTYALYQRTPDGTAAGITGGALLPQDVTVIGPNGRGVPVTYPSSSEHLTRGVDLSIGVAEFSTPTTGDYRLDVNASAESAIVVAPALSTTFTRLGLWILGGIGCGLVLALGVVLAIVGATRKPKPPFPYAGYPPAYGGYPAPYGTPTALYGGYPGPYGGARPGPPQYYPHQYYPHQYYPPQTYPPQTHPPQTHPPQGYPPQDYPPQDYPPQNYPPPGPSDAGPAPEQREPN